MGFPCGGVMPNWPAGNHMINNVATALTPPGCSGPNAALIRAAMQSVLSGGAAAMMQNPMAAASAALGGAVSSAATSLTAALGGAAAPLVAALTGGGAGSLAGALASHLSYTNAASGVSAPAAGQFSPMDLVTHALLARQFFGPPASEPSSVSVSSATAPLTASSDFATMQSQVTALAAAVIAGDTTVSAAVSIASGIASNISGTVSGSQSAISTMVAAQPALTSVMTIAGAAASTSAGLSTVAGILAPAGSPMGDLVSHILAITAPAAGEISAMASFPVAGGGGATGGR